MASPGEYPPNETEPVADAAQGEAGPGLTLPQPSSDASPTESFRPNSATEPHAPAPTSEATQAWCELTPSAPRKPLVEAQGRRVGPYCLVDRLGVGSQGDVWRAFRTEPFFQNVALKVLWPHVALDPARVMRFRKEAERAGRLTDPAILPVYDFGQAEGHAYIAMQLVEGFTLADVITQRKARLAGEPPAGLHRLAILPDGEYFRAVAETLVRVARGLHQAHLAHIVHRDVKPSNILLDREHSERVFLSDFGLARDLEDVTVAAGVGHPGTPVYMAPEKLVGRENVDEVRSDVYALGITLFETLTLDRPIVIPPTLPRTGWPTFILEAEPRRPRSLQPKLPLDLEAVVLKATDRNPARRYANAAELADDLERFVRNEPVQARPPGVTQRLGRVLARHRVALGFLACGLLAAGSWATARYVRDALAAQHTERIRRLAWTNLLDGRLEEAIPLVIEVHTREPNHRETRALVQNVTRAVFNETRDATDTDNVERALRWYERWLALEPRSASERAQFAESFGLQTVPVASNPPGALVTFHALRPNGQPKPGLPLYRIRAGSAEEPALLPEVVAGSYWVTAYDPATHGFVERLRDVQWSKQTDFRKVPGSVLLLQPRTAEAATREMRLIRGGTLMMGLDKPEGATWYPRHAVAVAEFYLDPKEVTNAQLDEFLTSSKRDDWRKRVWPGTLRPDPDKRDWPATRVEHQLAVEYAAWRGCRLPTEEELEWAARGQEERLVPAGWESSQEPSEPEWLSLHAVGKNPQDRVDTPDGPLFDLYANAGELTLFRYRPYEGNPPATQRAYWAGHVVRSGLISRPNAKEPYALGYHRRAAIIPMSSNEYVGFRCARSLKPRMNVSALFQSPSPGVNHGP